jgi:hypothetical protein
MEVDFLKGEQRVTSKFKLLKSRGENIQGVSHTHRFTDEGSGNITEKNLEQIKL